MTFLEIEAFLKIAQCGSFSAAAEKLYITQPALGRRIRALEEELGYSLFIRNKGVRLYSESFVLCFLTGVRIESIFHFHGLQRLRQVWILDNKSRR